MIRRRTSEDSTSGSFRAGKGDGRSALCPHGKGAIMIVLKNVLVATDFSEPSNTALDYGRAFARTFGATLHVVHVVESLLTPGIAEAAPADYGRLVQELEARGRRELEATVAEDDRRELNAQPVLLTSVAAAPGIVSYAQQAHVDLIVM